MKTPIDKMVDRFLSWKLPEDFYPDAGISFDHEHGKKWGMPTGTNLLHAEQAKAMFEHCAKEAIEREGEKVHRQQIEADRGIAFRDRDMAHKQLAAKDAENAALRAEVAEWKAACEQKEALLAPTKLALQVLQRENLALRQELEEECAKTIHSCHDNCTNSDCVNRRLREELEAMKAQGDPVAYLVLFENSDKLLEFTKGNYIHGAKVEHIPLYAHPAPIPKGYALVPIEPTEAMIGTGLRYLHHNSQTNLWAAYRGMVETAQVE